MWYGGCPPAGSVMKRTYPPGGLGGKPSIAPRGSARQDFLPTARALAGRLVHFIVPSTSNGGYRDGDSRRWEWQNDRPKTSTP